MPLELDHVFVCPEEPAAAVRALSDFGLEIGARRVHAGQGTANACFFFDNAYLEILWRHDDEELQSDVVRPLALWERVRWRETAASPFGIAFRPGGEIPVAAWIYDAPFLPAGTGLPIATPEHSPWEPLIFFSTISPGPPVALPAERRPPLRHRTGHHQVTAVTVCGPEINRFSPAIKTICDLTTLAIRETPEHCLELEWDGAMSAGVQDFRPSVPLVLRW